MQDNLEAFQKVWIRLGGSSENNEDVVDAEKVRFFLLNLSYLWGDWL